ncbi:hypothetical protein GCM10010245_49490 [Streptomyces spectabilis]|nr:hypothetical protein GCM10010245_49490 [Streptomyces spectabilis]
MGRAAWEFAQEALADDIAHVQGDTTGEGIQLLQPGRLRIALPEIRPASDPRGSGRPRGGGGTKGRVLAGTSVLRRV